MGNEHMKISFLQDFTNSCVLPYAFLFSYFACGCYKMEDIRLMGKLIREMSDKDKQRCTDKLNKMYKYFTVIGTIIIYILAILGTCFFIKNFETGIWLGYMPLAFKIIYSLVVCAAWIMSLTLVSESFYASAAFMEISRYDFRSYPQHSDKMLGFRDILKNFIFHLSLVLYYIIGAIVVVYSEISKARTMEVEAKHIEIVVLLMSIVMILYSAVNLIPLIQYRNILRQKAENAFLQNNALQFNLRLFSKENILTFFSTAIIPIITLLWKVLTKSMSQ